VKFIDLVLQMTYCAHRLPFLNRTRKHSSQYRSSPQKCAGTPPHRVHTSWTRPQITGAPEYGSLRHLDAQSCTTAEQSNASGESQSPASAFSLHPELVRPTVPQAHAEVVAIYSLYYARAQCSTLFVICTKILWGANAIANSATPAFDPGGGSANVTRLFLKVKSLAKIAA
jgi:hypothetical protein